MPDDEVPLRGGFVTDVVRVGDTVRRRPNGAQDFTHALLEFLEAADWPGAPRFLGLDDEGRELLSWIDGHVPWSGVDEPVGIYDATSVARVAELTRELHDLTAGTELAGTDEVVCHNDLSPKNTVYRAHAGRFDPIAFLDWDLAAPGRRLDDVAHLTWQWAVNRTSEVDAAATLARVASDAYGLANTGRRELIDTVLWWQDRCWRGIQARIDDADPSVTHLAQVGAVQAVQEDWAWTSRHRDELDAELR